jgi:hypothetical protein
MTPYEALRDLERMSLLKELERADAEAKARSPAELIADIIGGNRAERRAVKARLRKLGKRGARQRIPSA